MRALSIVTGCTLVLSIFAFGIARAQTPYIAVYFDPGYSQEAKDCQGVGVVDTWYVAAVNFNRYLSGAEFAIQYPPEVTWLVDWPAHPIAIGTTPTGISMGFPFQQNGYNPVPLCEVELMWNCSECGGPYDDHRVKVVAHPATGFLGGVDYPGFNLVPAVGLTASVCFSCACVPTQDTTWGGVKALYAE